MRLRTFVLAAALSAGPGILRAQFDFHLAGRDVQIHSFGSEGFAFSNQNNYLTMKTSSGAFFTEGAMNASTQITDKFRVGAQVFVRNVGHFGKWKPELDWAMGDYRFKPWFGVRAGKVKTTFGLYNDSQDMEFLQTWALLPQSIYAVDQRSSYIAHTGADLYGSLSPNRKIGTFSYTVWAGKNPSDMNGGYAYALSTIGVNYTSYPGRSEGADLRWALPVSGMTVGASYMSRYRVGDGTWNFTGAIAPVHEESSKEYLQQFYAQYIHGNFHADAEYRRYFRGITVNESMPVSDDTRSWYVSAAYRVHKRLELGTYYSRFVDVRAYTGLPATDPGSYLKDKVASARIDVNSHVYFKIEGHFMSGYAEEVNPSVAAESIAANELKNIFLATSSSLAGSHVEPVLEKEGAVHEAFLRSYLGKTDAALQTYYRSLVFTGKGAMPKVLGSDAEVVAYVAKTKGAIGYVSAAANTAGVKMLEVK